MPSENPLFFESDEAFRGWLEKHHDRMGPIWVRFLKKHVSEDRLTHAEALDQALCFGWIDGQVRPWDDQAWIQRWSARRPSSRWSRLNVQHATRLMDAGLMMPAGLKEVRAAQADGRWQDAYPSPREAELPEDFLRALKKNKKGYNFLKTLNKSNLYSIAYRLHHAKRPETRGPLDRQNSGHAGGGRNVSSAGKSQSPDKGQSQI